MNKQQRTADMRVIFSGHGHYRVTMTYRGKEISCITNNMPAIDDFQSEEFERDGRCNRILQGFNALRGECIRKNTKG